MTGKVKAAELLVGDMHLGDNHPRFEDFLDGEGFGRMIDSWVQRHPDAEQLCLRLTGDVLDFSSIRYLGRWGIAPISKAALARIDACLRSHRVFWSAIRRFLKDPRAHVVFLLGNHDLDLAWSEVKARLVKVLASGDADRVSFETESHIGDTLVVHGDGFDLLFDSPSSDRRFVRRSGRLELNVPVSSRFTVWLVSWLKHHCQPLGFLAQHGPAWALGLIRRSRLLSAMLFWLTTLQLKRHLAAHPNVRVVVAGHTHLAGVWDLALKNGRHVTYLNAGTAIAQVHPWKPWRPRWTEWTPVEIVSFVSDCRVQLLRFDSASATFSNW